MRVTRSTVAGSLLALFCLARAAATALPLGSLFTYQGTLLDDGVIPTGAYDFEVALYDVASGGFPLTTVLHYEDVPVAEGLFQLPLDFGGQFWGDRRWIELRVRDGGATGAYEALLPRQELTATPYAWFAPFSSWDGLFGVPAGFEDDVDDDLLNALPCAVGEVPILTGTGWDCATYAAGGGAGWQLTGNAGTIAGTHFLGTTDTSPLELRVDGLAALRIEQVAPAPNRVLNLVSGQVSVTGGLEGVTAFGGYGTGATANRVFSNWSTIGGGFANQAGSSGEPVSSAVATVAGGDYNLATAAYSTIGGGDANEATAPAATIGGGAANFASGNGATIGGGSENEAVGSNATIGGGGKAGWSRGNAVWNDFGTVAGGGSNEAGLEGSPPGVEPYATVGGGRRNVANRQGATIGGGELNRALAAYGFIGGGGPNVLLGVPTGNFVYGSFGTVGGGSGNTAGNELNEQPYATIGGGLSNHAAGEYAFIGGGANNAANLSATVAGGEENLAIGDSSTIGGGNGNSVLEPSGAVLGGTQNLVSGELGSIGGGTGNTAAGLGATIGGGAQNYASGSASTIAGGNANEASATAATVAGGNSNFARADHSAIAGGLDNEATGSRAAIGGGEDNLASGQASAIPGGSSNIAGCLNCLAAGSYAHAIHQGSFVWSEHTATAHVASPAEYTFSVQAAGGIWLGTDRSPSIPAGVFLNTSTGGYLTSTGAWTNSSDRNRKEGFAPVDGEDVLAKVRALPLTSWSYIGDPTGARHLGPMAQDFRAAFGLGQDDVSITTVDASGVALAAIQELARRTEQLELALSTVEALQRRLDALEAGR